MVLPEAEMKFLPSFNNSLKRNALKPFFVIGEIYYFALTAQKWEKSGKIKSTFSDKSGWGVT